MKNKIPSFRYSVIRIRQRRKSALIRNVMVSSIAVLLLIMSIAIAYWMGKPNNVIQSLNSSTHTTAETSFTQIETTTITTQTPTETSTIPTQKEIEMVGDEYFED